MAHSMTALRRWLPLAALIPMLLAVAAAPAAASAAAEAGGDGAVELVRETTDEVLDLIERARGYAEEDPERFYSEVESILEPVVAFDSFARSVMAAHYRKATPEQRERFAERFESGLVRTYAMALLEFDDGEVVVVPPDRPPRNPDRRSVRMEIRTPQGDVYPVLYSMARNDAGEWQVRNLIVNGVNMGLTYRNQFNSAMRDPEYGGDMDAVIDDWSEMLREEAPGLEGEGVPGEAAAEEPSA
ncbi:MAG: MlaC/ttg2D family ABC transporter substrate-binding protein [Pseudomonadota bacterium]